MRVLVKLIGVNKGRCVKLKYFSILIKVSRKHRLFPYISFKWVNSERNLGVFEKIKRSERQLRGRMLVAG